MFQSVYKLSKEQVSDYKELFILFDKDENGVLSFTELQTAMKTLGQRISGQYTCCSRAEKSWEHRKHAPRNMIKTYLKGVRSLILYVFKPRISANGSVNQFYLIIPIAL